MLPDDRRHGFVFHATDIYSGGRTLPRKGYDKNVRFPIMERCLSGPRELNLPVFFSWQFKHKEEDGWDPKNEIFFRHVNTFLECLKTANVAMKMLYPRERATLTAEDVPQMRRWLAQLPEIMRDPSAPSFISGDQQYDAIVDSPNFCTKASAPPLQFADAVAFSVRHYLCGHKDGAWAMQHLLGCADVEQFFAKSRSEAGGSIVLRWPGK